MLQYIRDGHDVASARRCEVCKMNDHSFSCGVIEGFYGRMWRWEDRKTFVDFLCDIDFKFYIYAPKGDLYLREKWRLEWPDDHYNRIMTFSEICNRGGIQFGVGLSPMEIYEDFGKKEKNDLRHKVSMINDLKPQIMCLCFDDMRGDNSHLAENQAKVFDFIADASTAKRFLLCPTYYSYDPLLETFFGEMPENYLSDLGKMIDPEADIFWTGTKVCSTEYTELHLSEVTDLIRRKPIIWDNYPVNDSPRMSPYLHLKAFTNRPYQMSEWTSGHAANPMNQAWLSQIPLKTLSMVYALKDQYDPDLAFVEAAKGLCGETLATCIMDDVSSFQERGLIEMSEKEKNMLIKKYGSFKSPYATEIVAWLEGKYDGQT